MVIRLKSHRLINTVCGSSQLAAKQSAIYVRKNRDNMSGLLRPNVLAVALSLAQLLDVIVSVLGGLEVVYADVGLDGRGHVGGV